MECIRFIERPGRILTILCHEVVRAHQSGRDLLLDDRISGLVQMLLEVQQFVEDLIRRSGPLGHAEIKEELREAEQAFNDSMAIFSELSSCFVLPVLTIPRMRSDIRLEHLVLDLTFSTKEILDDIKSKVDLTHAILVHSYLPKSAILAVENFDLEHATKGAVLGSASAFFFFV